MNPRFPPPAKLGKTPIRANPLVFGLFCGDSSYEIHASLEKE
jgi:hypothetical protein